MIIEHNDSSVRISKVHCPKFLKDSGVTAYLLHLSLESTVLKEYWQILTTEECDRALKFQQAADRVRFVIARSTLKRLLAKRLEVPVTDILLTKNKFGKPMLNDQLTLKTYLQFNVTHSGDKALIVFSNQGLVGADIEKVAAFQEEFKSLKTYIYSDEEVKCQSEQHCLNKISLSQTWVMKEAVVKAAGCGLHHDITSFSLIQDVKDKSMFRVKDVPFTWSKTIIWSFSYDKSYSSAIAIMPDPTFYL